MKNNTEKFCNVPKCFLNATDVIMVAAESIFQNVL